MLRVGYSAGRGRGIFATKTLRAGDLIEEAPVIVLSPEDMAQIKKTILYQYYFRWGSGRDAQCAICLGFGSLYNHDDNPNAKYVRSFERLTMRFIALRDIEVGEEIFTNYHGSHDTEEPLWFQNAPSLTAQARRNTGPTTFSKRKSGG